MRGHGSSGEYSQAELELSDTDVNGVNYEESYKLDSVPLEPVTEPHVRDIRDPVIRGGPGE